MTEHPVRSGSFCADGGGDLYLECPSCGNGQLHHDGVTVFDRPEDAADTKQTRIEGGKATTMVVPSLACRNPSNRRDGIAISFWCENCLVLSELTIAQHKGCTELGWRAVGKREDVMS